MIGRASTGSFSVGISQPRGLSPTQFLLDRSREALWRQVALSEWDLLELLELSARDVERVRTQLASISHQIVISASALFLFKNPDAAPERLSILRELTESLRARAVLIRMGAQQVEQALPWAPEQASPGPLELWLDYGKEWPAPLPPSPLRFSGTTRLVRDPLWHSLKTASNQASAVYKLHGWHPSRWIRYYGAEQLKQLARLCRRHPPAALLFAHSMRNEEGVRFERLYADTAPIRRASTP